MRLGYSKVWRIDDANEKKRQLAALKKAGVDKSRIYSDESEDLIDVTPGLDAMLKALRPGDELVVTSLSRTARDLRQLVRMIYSLNQQEIKLIVLDGKFPSLETEQDEATAKAVFAGLVNFESELRSVRTRDGMETARRFGRPPGRRPQLSPDQVRYAQKFLKGRNADPAQLCSELNITKQTLRKYMSKLGELREVARTVLEQEKKESDAAAGNSGKK